MNKLPDAKTLLEKLQLAKEDEMSRKLIKVY